MRLWRRRLAARVPVRCRLAWACLRGHPVAYRIRIESGGIVVGGYGGLIVECVIIGASGAAFTIGGGKNVTVKNCNSSG